MNELSNALQGKLNSRNSHVKDPSSDRQLDLFSSLSERSATPPKIIRQKPEPRAEPEMVLPPAGNPPDVSADVRAVLSESGPSRHVEAEPRAGAAPLRTGVYQRPRRVAPPPAAPVPPPPARKPAAARISPFSRIRAWFAGVELDRRLVSLVLVLVVLVAALAYWTAGPGDDSAAPGTAIDLEEVAAETESAPAVPAAAAAPAQPAGAASAPSPAPAAAAPAAGWKIPGAECVANGGAVLVRFLEPVFVSADKISVEGMPALKAVAAKLVSLKTGARVIVTGYTDNEPLSKPTPQFKSNADIAAARAKVVVEHLSAYARANKGLAFEARTGEPSGAPYPNDTPQNRRLNRTATVQVIPAP